MFDVNLWNESKVCTLTKLGSRLREPQAHAFQWAPRYFYRVGSAKDNKWSQVLDPGFAGQGSLVTRSKLHLICQSHFRVNQATRGQAQAKLVQISVLWIPCRPTRSPGVDCDSDVNSINWVGFRIICLFYLKLLAHDVQGSLGTGKVNDLRSLALTWS